MNLSRFCRESAKGKRERPSQFQSSRLRSRLGRDESAIRLRQGFSERAGNGSLNFKPRLIVKSLNAREARTTSQLVNQSTN